MEFQASKVSLSQSDVSVLIERLVTAIKHTSDSAFNISKLNSDDEQVQATGLSRHFHQIEQMVELFDDRCAYEVDEHLHVFWQACQEVGLELSPLGLTCLSSDETRYLSSYETLNLLTQRIRVLTGSKSYQRRICNAAFMLLIEPFGQLRLELRLAVQVRHAWVGQCPFENIGNRRVLVGHEQRLDPFPGSQQAIAQLVMGRGKGMLEFVFNDGCNQLVCCQSR